MVRSVLAAIVVGGAVVVFAGEPAPGTTSYARDVEPIMVKACADCHGGDTPKKGLNLERGKGYAALVGVASQELAPLTLVRAGAPAESVLWLKVSHAPSAGKGMPRGLFGSSKLPADQLETIERWIKDGALP